MGMAASEAEGWRTVKRERIGGAVAALAYLLLLGGILVGVHAGMVILPTCLKDQVPSLWAFLENIGAGLLILGGLATLFVADELRGA